MAAGQAKYKRILLKLSGEALQGGDSFGINHEVISEIAAEIKEVHDLGVEIAIVTGGGNFFRGAKAGELGIDRASADYGHASHHDQWHCPAAPWKKKACTAG